MTRDIALICGDGGIKGGFIAGVLTGLMERFPEDMMKVSTVVGTSASVGSTLYYVSHGLLHPGEYIWNVENSSPRFIEFKGLLDFWRKKPIYNIDYLADEIFARRHPLNIAEIEHGSVEYYFSCQKYRSNEIFFFGNRPSSSFKRGKQIIEIRDFRGKNIYDLIKAATAAPFVYDRTVTIDGELLMDAASLEPFTLDLPALKGKKKMVIVSRARWPIKTIAGYLIQGGLWPVLVTPFKRHKFKASVYWQYACKPFVGKRLMRDVDTLTRLEGALLISPEEPLGGNLDNSPSTLKANFSLGRAAVNAAIEEIGAFFDTP